MKDLWNKMLTGFSCHGWRLACWVLLAFLLLFQNPTCSFIYVLLLSKDVDSSSWKYSIRHHSEFWVEKWKVFTQCFCWVLFLQFEASLLQAGSWIKANITSNCKNNPGVVLRYDQWRQRGIARRQGPRFLAVPKSEDWDTLMKVERVEGTQHNNAHW